ncbi:venom allergen 5-like [Pararge aegeria]|uniref:venom allergen 5-like n=1 Tax=Pararge aegeria TaxID=116150 RepID=UPI0019D1B532|nr:venom allergen 5-like [Pararge aegeria]
MIKIKILVLVLYFSDIFACSSEYCNICPEHTLCKYKVSGPSPQCMGYDKNALLTKTDINDILEKINERRNFIANGKSRFLPEAANMKKIVWSEELAIFAQRWVDQCDISLKPDRKDKCRDLDHSEVGQSIATIEGSSVRYEKLNVRSFVEIWFMESMEYTGNVAFYNQSRDHKANYFTQLIWADTDKVGCGKARFLIKNAKPVAVHRLVCNFAPKGNVHRKPVYTIGYAATQCSIGMEPDSFFPGLCSHPFKQKGSAALRPCIPIFFFFNSIK